MTRGIFNREKVDTLSPKLTGAAQIELIFLKAHLFQLAQSTDKTNRKYHQSPPPAGHQIIHNPG